MTIEGWWETKACNKAARTWLLRLPSSHVCVCSAAEVIAKTLRHASCEVYTVQYYPKILSRACRPVTVFPVLPRTVVNPLRSDYNKLGRQVFLAKTPERQQCRSTALDPGLPSPSHSHSFALLPADYFSPVAGPEEYQHEHMHSMWPT